MTTQPKKLYRRPSEGKIFGVIAGLAEYFSMDVTVLRIIAVVLVFAGVGIVVPIYFALAFFLPVEKSKHANAEEKIQTLGQEIKDNKVMNQGKNYLALGLIVIGGWLLVGQLFPEILEFNWNIAWPVIIILIGLVLLVNSKGRKNG